MYFESSNEKSFKLSNKSFDTSLRKKHFLIPIFKMLHTLLYTQ